MPKRISVSVPDELAAWIEKERKSTGLSNSAFMVLLAAEAKSTREQKQALLTLAETVKHATPEQIQKAAAEMYGDPDQLTLAALAVDNAI